MNQIRNMSRVEIHTVQPTAYKGMGELEAYMGTVDLPIILVELAKIRASQINGCAYCIQMHSQAALKSGETHQRLFALSAWKESPLFTNKERCVLALVEEVTLIFEKGVSDTVYTDLQDHFNDEQVAQLIMVVTIINAWNRIAIATHVQ